MSYFTAPKTKRVELTARDGNDQPYWVEVKTNLKYGDAKAFISVSKDGTVDQIAGLDTFLKAVIVTWNLDDGDGNVAPIDAEHINQLDQQDAVAIINTAGAAVAGNQEAKADFLGGSEPSSTPDN